MNRAAHRRRTANFINTVLLFTVAFVLGIAVTLGSIVGGIYALLTYVSIDRVEELAGVDIADGVLEEDSVLRSLSVIGLVSEAIAVSGDLSATTFNSLMEKYGVIVSEETRDYIPDGLVDLPFSELAGDNAAHVLLSHVTFGDVFDISGEFLPAALAAKITSRTLDLAVEQKFDQLLEGVYLGDIIDVALEVREDGLAYPIVPDGERPRLVDHLATLDLGAFFAAEDTDGKDAVLNSTLGRVPLTDMIAEEDGLFSNALSDKSLGDLLIIKGMSPLFSTAPILEDLYLGDVLGYHLVEAEDGVGESYWADKNDKPAKGIYRELVGISVNDLGDTDVMAKIDNVYVAELMDYEREEIGVDENGEPIYRFYRYDENGKQVEPGGMTADLAVLKVGELRNEDTLNAEIRDMKIGVVMGYQEDENGRWYQLGAGGSRSYAQGVMRPLLGSTVGTLDEDMDKLYLGQVMGYDILTNEDGLAVDKLGNVIEDENGVITGEPVFIRDDNNDGVLASTESAPGALMAEFVSLKLANIDDESEFTDRVKNVRVGDAMGYTKNEDDGKWYQKNSAGDLVPVTGIFASLSDSKVNELDGAVQELSLSDALGYEKQGDAWVKNGTKATGIFRVLMEKGANLSNISDKSKEIQLGEVMGYTKTDDGFEKNGVPASGLIAEFVDLSIGDLEDDSALTDRINNMSVGVAMGYRLDGEEWVDALGNPATGFMELIGPGTKIKDLDGSIKNLQTSEGGSIEMFMKAGILNIDESTQDKLDMLPAFNGWRQKSIGEFVNMLIGAATSPLS